jgi:hypothetical protein
VIEILVSSEVNFEDALKNVVKKTSKNSKTYDLRLCKRHAGNG